MRKGQKKNTAGAKGRQSAASHGPSSLLKRLLGLFFLSAWMFTLGLFVGRGTAPVQFDIEALQKELQELRAKVLKEEQQRIKSGLDGDPGQTELEFFEALKSTEDDLLLPKEATEKRPKANPAPSPDSASKPAESSQTKASQARKDASAKGAQAQSPIKAAKDGRSTKASDAKSTFTIQVASLKDAAAADAVVAKLKGKGFPAYRTMAVIAGKGIWYRVRVGQFASRSEAGTVIQRLNKMKFTGIVVSVPH